MSLAVNALPKLSSYPSATATIFLDFDGHLVSGTLWNGGSTFACAPAPLTDDQITAIFNSVSEDFRPFNVNITTDSVMFSRAPITQRIRMIVTPTSSWRTGVGGVSYIGSFTWGDDTPGFIFTDRLGPNNEKFIAECCSHEIGHTLGLSHQSKYDNNCSLVEVYNTGDGTGETSWAPIMGNSYNRNMTVWNNGPTPSGCGNLQDNLGIITSANGFTYKADDYSDETNENAFTPNLSSGTFSNTGIISTSTDKDVFKFNISNPTSIRLNATPYLAATSFSGSDLDIKIYLFDGAQNLLRTFDPIETMSVSIDTTLGQGTYYFVVDGTGNSFTSNYGSIGSYTLTGNIAAALAIHEIKLNGTKNHNQHSLNWNIISDEPIKSQIIEYSDNGENFQPLASAETDKRNYSYSILERTTRYYRLKITSSIGEIGYSNIIVIRGSNLNTKSFEMNNMVNSQLTITATETFQYKLFDANGRYIQTGKGNAGMNNINMWNVSNGIYYIQMIGMNNNIQTERIVKQ